MKYDNPKASPVYRSKRDEILSTARDTTAHENRGRTHGNVQQNMQHTAALFSAYLGHLVTPTDVGQLMVLLKSSRIKSGIPITDHFVDQAAYSAISGEMAYEAQNSLMAGVNNTGAREEE